MKKRIAVLMLGLMFVLSACGGSTKVIEGEVATTSQQEESLEQTEDTSVEADESEEKVMYSHTMMLLWQLMQMQVRW